MRTTFTRDCTVLFLALRTPRRNFVRRKSEWSQYTGYVNKNLMLYKNACWTKPTFGKWYSLFILQWQLSLDQNIIHKLQITKLTNYLWVLNLFFKFFLQLKFWASGFCWRTLDRGRILLWHKLTQCSAQYHKARLSIRCCNWILKTRN